MVGHALLLEGDDLLADRHHSEVQLDGAEHPLGTHLLDVGLGFLLGLRVPVAGELPDERAAAAQVELLDLVRLAEVHVDRAGMDGGVRALGLDGADHLAALLVDDGEGVDRRRPQRDPPGREPVAARQVTAPPLTQLAEPDQPFRVGLPARAEDLAVVGAERELVRRGGQMRQVDALALVVEDRALDRTVEELVGVAAEELVECVIAGHVHGEPGLAATGAAPHLPQAGHRPGEGHADCGLEVAHVDPELERVRRHHREEVSLREPMLDLPPLRRRVAGAVGRDPVGQVRVASVLEPEPREAVDQLDPAARSHEADRPHAVLDQPRQDAGGLPQHRRAGAGGLVDERRVPHHHLALAGGGAVAVDQPAIVAHQPLGELLRVRDRGAGEHEPRRCSIRAREAPQPA